MLPAHRLFLSPFPPLNLLSHHDARLQITAYAWPFSTHLGYQGHTLHKRILIRHTRTRTRFLHHVPLSPSLSPCPSLYYCARGSRLAAQIEALELATPTKGHRQKRGRQEDGDQGEEGAKAVARPFKKAKSGSSTPHGSGPSTQSSLSACTRCLRRHPHDIANCAATTLWDKNTPVRCEWNKQKRLVNPKGTVLCSDWQRRQGCKSSSHPFRHECSGCGSTEHGAQTCQLAENPDN